MSYCDIIKYKGKDMQQLLTVKENEKYLRQISKNVDFSDNTYKEDIKNLKDFFKNNKVGYALASIQLAIPKRIIYINSTSEDCKANQVGTVLINPVITKSQGKTEFWEACFSCGLGELGLVERPYKIEVEYIDENGKKNSTSFEGFSATVISHEIDHLDGIFHLDRAKQRVSIDGEKRFEFRNEHPYKIISKTCEFEYVSVKVKEN